MNEDTLLEDLNSLGIRSGVNVEVNGIFRGKPIDDFVESREINKFNKGQRDQYKIVSFTGDIRPNFTEFWITFESGLRVKLESLVEIFQEGFVYKLIDFSGHGGFTLTELPSFSKRWPKGIWDAENLAEILYFLKFLADEKQSKKRWTGVPFSNPLSMFLSPCPHPAKLNCI